MIIVTKEWIKEIEAQMDAVNKAVQRLSWLLKCRQMIVDKPKDDDNGS